MILGGIMPIPIFFNNGGGGGHGSLNFLLAALIIVNLIVISIVLVRAAIWYYKTQIKKSEYFTFFEYVIWSEYCASVATAGVFIIFNSLYLFFWLVIVVTKWLNNVNPTGA